ncbi:zeta toxin family protein [Croceibacterium sp. LX-88]|uniref:Zeta toxin family protein n=1 Tax=Croceibacterium selenioxidans TaxID=2838833 RepID=A0ABS5W5D6_9SPHN|nr:zeta toxin family protein [Croceibacterium selenioxidans]MBT2134430.1 zeta toxin family protein [Croceibacterium selenioxidans]
MREAIDALIAAEGLPGDYREVVENSWRLLADCIANQTKRPLLVGINGAQGSGKTTLCRFLQVLLEERGLRAVTLSLDDLYLTHAERKDLARDEHPLFATRGVPGTHDVALGERLFDGIASRRPVTLPIFNKAIDDRAPGGVLIDPPVDVILFEGWCVGTVPQPAAALREPVNRLEAEEDSEGAWRREVNRRLATDYAELFGRIDLLIMLRVAGFEAVRANRLLQEQKLAASNPVGKAVMDEAALDRFLMHYERLTRWTLSEMPERADIVIPIGADQRPV